MTVLHHIKQIPFQVIVNSSVSKKKVLFGQFNTSILFQVNDNEDTTSEQFYDIDDELEEVARETVADREVLAAEGADGDNHESSVLFDQTVDTELMSNL